MTLVNVSDLNCNFACHFSLLDPEADIWLGEMEFVNLFCGTGRSMPPILSGVGTQIRGIGSAIGGIFQRQRRQAANGQTPTDINQLTAEELNKYKLDHSLLYFRGKAYEWGAGEFEIFNFLI